MRACVGCGEELPHDMPLQRKRCRKNCGNKTLNQARAERREAHEIDFIGVDGEGVTYCAHCGTIKDEPKECILCGEIDWKHDYVLLTVGNERPLYNEDASHLHYSQIFEYLYGCFERKPNAAYVGFFLGYDFTQWVRTLPQNRASSLLSTEGIAKRARKNSGDNKKPFPVHIGTDENLWQWEIDTLGMKRFTLRPGTGHPPGKVKNKHKPMNICDTGAFFQKRFIDVIASHIGTLITQEEFNMILEGKMRRSTARLDKDMKRYNALENDILSRVMKQLNEGFTSVGIRLNKDQWFGPGQAAQKWLSNIGATPAKDLYKHIPKYAAEAARKTYYGGWFEIFRHGIVKGTSYEYDINSAYPHAISTLPCLLHGKWTHKTGMPVSMQDDPKILRMLHIRVSGSDRVCGTLPHRTPKNAILRPYKTTGWYWEHELKAALKAGLIDGINVSEYIEYEGCECPSPFRSIANLYEKRLEVGKNTPSGMAYKLVYNSAYGKMAQSVGKPKFANSIYASLITASCRTRILEAIATHPNGTEDLLMVATDGVYFRSPHPELELNDQKLGYWSEETKENLCLFMPGVYWDDSSRKALAEGQEVRVKSRGISAKDLALCIQEIDEQFRELKPDDHWPGLDIPILFDMTSAKLALARGKWNTAGKVTFDGVKHISASPGIKRDSNWVYDESGTITTAPYDQGIQLETTPYEKLFAQEDEMDYDWEITPDGTTRLELNTILHG